MYRECPLRYKLQYIDKLKPKERFYLSFGDVIHQCAEYFFKVPVPPPPPLVKLLDFYEANWISAGYESPAQEEEYKFFGRQLLDDFWKTHYPTFKMPLAVEQQFYLNIAEGVTLAGKIDRVDKLDSGVSIVDYKTSKELFTAEHMEQDLQLTFYQLAVEQMWKMPVKKLTLYHLRSNTPCTCDGRSKSRLSEARQIVLNVANGIQRQEFPAKENQYCSFCDFPQHCPYHKHEYTSEESVPDAAKAILQGEQAREVVERYAALQAQKKALEDEIEQLRQSICEYCEAVDLNRLYGNDHAITYKIVERSGFSEEKVRSLLEPTGLWPRVLKYDASLVKDLLDADYLNAELRKKLLALKETTTSYPQLSVKKLRGEEG
jgi:RecB family exonuclease